MQGFDVHSRIIHRIHGLLDRQLLELSDALMSENKYLSFNETILILQNSKFTILQKLEFFKF